MDGSASSVTAAGTLADAPEVFLRRGPYDVVLPADGRGFVRLEIAEPTTILVFALHPREAVRMIAPLRAISNGISPAAAEACGAESAGADLGFGGSDEYCREKVRDHRYYDAFRSGSHFLELRSRNGPVRVWLSEAVGHRFDHHDEHTHQ